MVNKINEMFKYERIMRENEYTKVQVETYRNGEEYQKTIKELDELIMKIDYGSNSLLKKAVEHYKNDKDILRKWLYRF